MANKAKPHRGTRKGLRWDDVLSTGVQHDFAKTMACHFLNRVQAETLEGISVWKRICDCIGSNRFLDLCNLDLDYRLLRMEQPEVIASLRQALAFYQKNADLDLGLDRKAVAKDTFFASEHACSLTNQTFRAWSQGRFQFRPVVERVLHSAQRKIASCLGDVPDFEELKLRFGPGATTSRKKRFANPRYKLGDPLACSEGLVQLLPKVLAELPMLLPFSEDVGTCDVEIHTARVDFVRKSAKTDRAIVVEPSLNSMVQLGLGDYIARRLQMIGVDIHDQSRNQRLAGYGSRTGELATLDLSSASDTIATGLVAHLLPFDWFELLDLVRSRNVSIDGHLVVQEKFSSMGNGFTFPLETLIFHSISCACCEIVGKTDFFASTYGDDIIVPTDVAPLLAGVLADLGFKVNPSKSFWDGPFRESCGADYFCGIDVRPVYLRGGTLVATLFAIHNFFIRKHDVESAHLVKRFIPPYLWLYGPDNYGDGHLVDLEFGKCAYTRQTHPPKPDQRARGYQGLLFDTFTFGKRRDFSVSPGDHILPAYSIYARDSGPERDPLKFLEVGSPSEFCYRQDRLGVVLPGTEGYKRISIYTLG